MTSPRHDPVNRAPDGAVESVFDRIWQNLERLVPIVEPGSDIAESERVILERRAARYGEAERTYETGPDNQADRALVFSVDRERFAVDVTSVRAVIELPAMTTIPGTPDYIAGLVFFEGRVVSVFDLLALVGGAGRAQDAQGLICVGQTHPVGLLFSAIDQVRPLDISRSDPTRHDTGLPACMRVDGSITVVDVDAMLADPALRVRHETLEISRTERGQR